MPEEPIHSGKLDARWIPAAVLLSGEAGWNQLAADWAVFFTHGTVLGATLGERLVATAAVLPYAGGFGWVSMVLVTAEYRGRGLATRLVTACTAMLRDSGRAALLDAAPAGAAIYSRLGYAPICAMHRWQGPGKGLGGREDLGSAPVNLALDTAAFGADRRFLLRDFLSRPGSLRFQSSQGLAIARKGAAACQIGPVIATSRQAPALIEQAIRACVGPVVIDVLDAGGALHQTLASQSFRRQRGFTRMALGLSKLPGNPAHLLAAAGPEFG